MKQIIQSLIMIFMVSGSVIADVRILAVKGEVSIRRGVHEQWTSASVGDILKPEDSMRSGENSTASILVDGTRKLVLPELVIIDISDLRYLTQEELLLKLAMEDIRSVPPRRSNDELIIPRTTTVHGADKGLSEEAVHANPAIGKMQLNGTRVLFEQGFYATGVLKAKEVFRFFPDLKKRIDVRLIVADALERMKLNGEAIGEYAKLLSENLTPEERTLVEQKLTQLRKKSEG